MDYETVLGGASAACAFLAAAFWFRAATIKPPGVVSMNYGGALGDPLPFVSALRSQNRANSRAAAFAAGAAILQGILALPASVVDHAA